MDRRNFIKSVSTVVISIPFFGFVRPSRLIRKWYHNSSGVEIHQYTHSKWFMVGYMRPGDSFKINPYNNNALCYDHCYETAVQHTVFRTSPYWEGEVKYSWNDFPKWRQCSVDHKRCVCKKGLNSPPLFPMYYE